ncbi:MAG: type II secretion system ATPase GspE [Nitrospira sp.]|nr:type II secretion system ATPase GspE [Nitrospira sp.]
MIRSRQLIGQILHQKYSLSSEHLEEALRIQKEKGGRLGEILIRLRYIKEEDLLQALGIQLEIPYMAHLDKAQIDRDLIQLIPIGFAKRYELIPLKNGDEKALVATSNPLNLSALDDLRVILGRDISVAIAPPSEILNCIHQIYERPSDSAEQVVETLNVDNLDELASGLNEPVDLREATDEAPIIRLVNSLMFEAVKRKASDIHLEPFERELAIRYRIDGILYNILTTPKRLQPSITSRIKIMAGLNIAEKRLPQDGRIGIKIAGRDVDIRVSAIPTAHGERLVLRLLDKTHLLLSLEDLGLDTDKLKQVAQLIRMSHGILLVTGPTGSGKTTTLYAALNTINSPDKNIITIEDPIEYQLKGIGQMQVNPKIDLTFANGLRSILRQDPDVIMVGEIRDVETAEIAIHASLTGHLVFSTLHTNDSAGAMTRLLDMGIEPFLVSSSVVAIIAQRLIRKICPDCQVGYSPPLEELEKLGLGSKNGKGKTFYRGQGCASCINTGYRGRTGIYEILVLDDEIRNLILSKTDANTIKNRAVEKGMTTLKQDGAVKVIRGVTTTEEVLRVTQDEILNIGM